MTITSALALYSTMIVLALLPGPGVVVVVARALDSGFRQGLATAMGILSGDFIFIALAIFGLAALSEVMGSFFVIIKYVGAAYIIYLGYQLITSGNSDSPRPELKPANYSTNYLVGLATSVSNPKVTLFYLSFFPAFLDLENISMTDVGLLFFIATFSVGLVMAGYAYVAAKTKSSFAASPKTKYLKFGSGALLIGGGVFVALRS
jgi:threonine/homoserine/homoserine lactone efflux protein